VVRRLFPRRRFVVAALLAVAVATTLADAPQRAAAQTAQLEVIRLGGVPTDDLTPVYWGVKSGMYAKAGLDVQIVPTSSGTAATTAVVAGSYEMGKASLISVMLAHLKGFPIALIAGGAVWDPKIPFAQVLVAADSTLKMGPDLNGKTVGVPALNDLNTLVISAWVDKTGGDSKTLKFVEIPNSVSTAALVDHRIDVGVQQEPQLASALDSGKLRSLVPAYNSVSTHFMFGAYFVNTDWAAKHAAAAKTFARVTYEAAAYTNAHHAETAAMMADITKIPLAVIEKMGRVDGATSASPDLIQPLIDVAAKYKQIPRAFPAKDLFLSN
jgi:NitT/TauT family transport system substrate-binding protein